MKDSLETKLGIFVALALIAGVLLLEIAGGTERFRRGVRVHALFTNVQELKEGDRVKMAGVDIGKVEAITLADDRVKVTMKLHPGHRVKTDSVAVIKFTGLMGQNFVAIDFGSPTNTVLATEDTILSSREQPDFGSLLAKLDQVASGVENLTRGFAGDEIQNLAGTLTGFIKDNRDQLHASIVNLSNITRQIAAGEGTVGRLIYDDALYTSALTTVSNLNQTGQDIRETVAEARTILQGINAGQGTVGKLVKDEALYAEAAASMTQFRESMANLREILQKVNRGEGSVGRLINDPSLFQNAKLTLQKLDKATESIEDQGPLSIMGMVLNSLF